MKKLMSIGLSALLSASLILNTCVTASAANVGYQPNQAASEILASAYQELGFSESQILSLSATNRNTLYYAYVNASGLVQNVSYTLSYSVFHDNTLMKLEGAIVGDMVNEATSSFSVTGGSLKEAHGSLIMNAPPTDGTVCILVYTSRLGTQSAGTINAGVNNRTCVTEPAITALAADGQLVSNASSYLSHGIYGAGDLNHDGLVSSLDTAILAGHFAEDPNCGWTSSMTINADVNRDGSVNSTDLYLIMQYQGGTIDSFESYSYLI